MKEQCIYTIIIENQQVYNTVKEKKKH